MKIKIGKLNKGAIFLFISKVIKILRIRITFYIPTIWAKLYLSSLDCNYGDNLKVNGKVYFRPNGKGTIQIGNNVVLTARFLTNTVGISNPMILECIGNGCIQIGDNTGLTSTIISSRSLIKIGNNVNVGANVRLFDHDFHSIDYLKRRNGIEDKLFVKSAPILIEDDVFIGTNSIILKGVTIGARSIIAAGSVVTLKNIPPDSLVVGNPAKIMKTLESC